MSIRSSRVAPMNFYFLHVLSKLVVFNKPNLYDKKIMDYKVDRFITLQSNFFIPKKASITRASLLEKRREILKTITRESIVHVTSHITK